MVILTELIVSIGRGFTHVMTDFGSEEHARVGIAAALNITISSTNLIISRDDKHIDMKDTDNLTGFLFEHV